MKTRRTIGAAMVALLVLVSPVPMVCSQCQFAAAEPNCHESRRQPVASPQNASMPMAGEHCQHMANSESTSDSHMASTGPCQDRSCQQLLDPATKMNRWDFFQLADSFRIVVATQVSGDHHSVAQDFSRGRIETPPVNPSGYEPLSVSLRV